MKKADVLLCIFIVVFAVILLCLQFGNDTGNIVEIYLSGELFGKYELFSDAVIEVESESGSNTVCISDGSVYVAESSCEDKNEVLQGKINRSGQSLVCLPNKLIVTVKGRRESVDSISY